MGNLIRLIPLLVRYGPQVVSVLIALAPFIKQLLDLLDKPEAAEVATDAVRKEVVKVREKQTHDPFPRDIRDAAGQ